MTYDSQVYLEELKVNCLWKRIDTTIVNRCINQETKLGHHLVALVGCFRHLWFPASALSKSSVSEGLASFGSSAKNWSANGLINDSQPSMLISISGKNMEKHTIWYVVVKNVWNMFYVDLCFGWWYTYPSEKYEFVSWDDYSKLFGKS